MRMKCDVASAAVTRPRGAPARSVGSTSVAHEGIQVARHPRFEEHRWLGDKATFVVYDCDDDEQYQAVEALALEKIASFGPDTVDEARNRGYRPVPGTIEELEPAG